MNRRSFFRAALAAAAVAAVDPERLLWTPGRKLISIPAVDKWTAVQINQAPVPSIPMDEWTVKIIHEGYITPRMLIEERFFILQQLEAKIRLDALADLRLLTA